MPGNSISTLDRLHSGHFANKFAYNADVDKVTFDPNLVQYILVNLLSNAIKYSPLNGVVRFEVANTEDSLIFRVSDNGIGIPEQDQARLFEPFHRAENTRGIGGTGLGLSIVKSYVEAQHGNIEFQSQENQGAVFTVYIPLEIGC
jgi:signal transduction histidine kinase